MALLASRDFNANHYEMMCLFPKQGASWNETIHESEQDRWRIWICFRIIVYTTKIKQLRKKIKMNSATPVQDFHSVSMSKWNWAWVRI